MNKRTILVVDDDTDMLDVFAGTLDGAGFAVQAYTSCEDALEAMRQKAYELVLTDLVLPGGMGGLELIEEMRRVSPDTDAIVATGHSSVDSAVNALRLGAFDYLTKPFDPDELVQTVRRVFAYRDLLSENERLRGELAGTSGPGRLIAGPSEAMRRVLEVIRAVAPMPSSVLIRGASGTGKELVADELHRLSPRAEGPLIKVNCAALPENLLEDELFGHEKGAFTGAAQKRAGRFEEADHGTIFLDEIGEMSPVLQAKLLRVLQERTFQRVGSSRDISIDVRIICATNADLESKVAQGQFREDLYYRINVVQIHLPALQERPEDIPVLVEELARRIALRLGLPTKPFSAEALAKLQQMPFPGNVRELQNLIERVLIFSRGSTVLPVDIPEEGEMPVKPSATNAVTLRPRPVPETALPTAPPTPELLGNATLEEIEREAIRRTLEQTGGNMYRTAKLLDISRSTLYSKVKKLGIDPKENSRAESE